MGIFVKKEGGGGGGGSVAYERRRISGWKEATAGNTSAFAG